MRERIMKEVQEEHPTLKISEEIRRKYPDLAIGVVIGRNVSNRKKLSSLEQFKRESENKLRNSPWFSKNLSEHPFIAAWRDTYRSFGVNPKRHTPTAESIIKRILKGKTLPNISAIVDTYLAVEIGCFLPIGGYDLDTVSGDIILRFSSGNEPFHPLGGGEQKLTKPGEVVYSDNKQVLTTKWNFLDCDSTKITLETKNFILCMERADPRIPINSLKEATNNLRETLEQFCPGDYENFIIQSSK